MLGWLIDRNQIKSVVQGSRILFENEDFGKHFFFDNFE